jgi:hypothetical protein
VSLLHSLHCSQLADAFIIVCRCEYAAGAAAAWATARILKQSATNQTASEEAA